MPRARSWCGCEALRRLAAQRESGRLAELGSLCNFVEPARLDIVDVAVDRNLTRHEGVSTDALHVRTHALRLVPDREPVDDLAFRRSRPGPGIAPAVLVQGGGLKAAAQQLPHDLIGEGLHAAIGMVDHEPF